MYKEMHGVFEVIEDAIDAAYEAQRILEANYTTEDRQKFIDAVKAEALKVVNEETIKEFEETGYGRLDQKLVKNYGSIVENPGVESLKHEVLASGKGVTIDFAAPYGTVGALTPVTNGLVTVVCNTLSMLAAGNTIVFNAHPAGKESACKACDLVNRAIVEAGGPDNVCTMIADPTYETLDVIMASDKIKMLIGTGGEGMVAKLMSSNKKVIAAGPGNPPAVIDETANVKQAAQVLYEMVPFENNMLCITEKEAFVVESVYDEFVEAMKECGARVLTEEEAQKVIDLCIAQRRRQADAQQEVRRQERQCHPEGRRPGSGRERGSAAGCHPDRQCGSSLCYVRTAHAHLPHLQGQGLGRSYGRSHQGRSGLPPLRLRLDCFSGTGYRSGQGTGLHLLRHERPHRWRHRHDGHWLRLPHHRCLHRRRLHHPQHLYQIPPLRYVPGRCLHGLRIASIPFLYTPTV